MSWLQTVGKDILKGISIATAIAQGVDPFIKGTAIGTKVEAATSELGTIGNLATIVESTANAFGANTGNSAAKLAAVLPYVSSLIQGSELMVGKQVADEQGFEDGCSQIVSGVVKILNSVKKQAQQPTAVPVLPPTTPPAAGNPVPPVPAPPK